MTAPDHAPADLRLNFVGGTWQSAADGKTRVNVNPADTTDVVGEFSESGAADADAAVAAAVAAGDAWRERGAINRAEILAKAHQLLTERSEEIAAVITREQGKQIDESAGEVRRALSILDFTRGEARRLGGETLAAEEPRTFAFTFRPPIGVVGLISPWNFPLAIPMWKVAPALLSGCTAVLKPSPLTPLSAAMLVQAFADAVLPDGVLNLVQGDRMAGEALVANPRVAGISFTGSLPVGLSIQEAAAPRLARTQLELGGKNAVVVLDDADLDAAVPAIVHGAFGQAGQRCSATSRVVVDLGVKEELLARLVDRVAALRVGPGPDPATDICPVVNADRMNMCLDAVEKAVAQGAKVAVGGGQVTDRLPPGYYVRPTVLRDVPRDSEIANEEVFGPVLSVIDVDGFDDAVQVANSVKYGMSATVFTRNVSRVFDAIDRFEAGMLHVNRPGVGAYAHLPHVGTRLSQYGAPECSPHVWDFYTEWRSACVRY
jgi:acyl-CoA reductase-like NAD-dependent aldehyde dehydrogenase